MRLFCLALTTLVLAFGCGSEAAPESATSTAPAAPAPAEPTPPAAEPPPPPAPPPLGTPREIAGLRVTPGTDATIRIEGTDRWGTAVDATYQSVDFLEPALPVYERSLTAEQVAGLRALITELRPGTPAPAAPTEPPAAAETTPAPTEASTVPSPAP